MNQALAHGTTSAIIDTLRMTDRDLVRVLAGVAGIDAELDRWPLRTLPQDGPGPAPNLPRMLVRLQDRQSGGWVTHLIKPREIHGQDMRFVLGGFVHEQTRCMLLLRDDSGRPAQLEAHVIACRHVHGRLHEITASFERPISPEQYRFPDGTPVAGLHER